MTHDELLEEIDDRFSETCDAHCESCNTKNFPIKALRAVVELVKPNEYDSTDSIYWKQVIIQAIEKELS